MSPLLFYRVVLLLLRIELDRGPLRFQDELKMMIAEAEKELAQYQLRHVVSK